MKIRSLVPLLCAGALFTLADNLEAHGGIYRGPIDVVPPSPGGGGRSPTGPSGPTTGGHPAPTAPTPSGPNPTGPSTPGGSPTAPVPGGRGPRTGGGVAFEPDQSTWEYWWEFNKDAYLRLKDAVHAGGPTTGDEGFYMSAHRFRREVTLKPTGEQLQNDVLPALHRAIEATDQRDIASSCMIAMAKIGQDHPQFRLVDVMRKRLQSNNQEIRETAALAIGIAARVEHGELDLLTGLALDDNEGRRACGGEVDTRTRAFAIHGIGLLAREHSKIAIKRAAFTTLKSLVDDDSVTNRNLKVAAILAIGVLDLGTTDAADRVLRDEAVACLERYYGREAGAGEQLIQAHCPTVLAKLVGRTGDASARCKQRFADELRGDDHKRRSADIARSCVLALGQLCTPHDDAKSADAAYSKLLWQVHVDHRDEQTRNFAVLALGQIGGAANRELLVRSIGTAKKALERPWFALALGVMAHAGYEAQVRNGVDVSEDRDVGEVLAEQLAAATEPGLVGALGVGLGLCRHLDAAPAMRDRLLRDLQKEAQAGYLCLGLALMDDRDAIEPLHSTIAKATRRPDLLKQAAVALGLLGDKTAAETLRAMLGGQEDNLATFGAAASALGLIGDRRSIAPLQRMLFDEGRSTLSRAFAAVALGGIADRAPLPWHAAISANLNYRAAVETLVNQQSGILDIL